MDKKTRVRLEEIARQKFLELLGKNQIPESEAKRISIGTIIDGDRLIVKITLVPDTIFPANSIWIDDLSGNIPVCKIMVDSLTDHVEIDVINEMSWLMK